MGRTTTCRSSLSCGLLVAALLGASPLAAQDTTGAQAAPPPGQIPASHMVQRGETLWSIAQLYYADPLLWPEIYRLNTAVIEDPHWIYPGEVLNLAPMVAQAEPTPEVQAPMQPGDTLRAQNVPGDTLRAAADTPVVAPADTVPPDTAQAVIEEPPPPEPEPVVAGPETIFSRRRRQGAGISFSGYAGEVYRPVRRGEFYAAGFLTEQEELPYARVLGATARPAIQALTPQTTARVFGEIAIQPRSGASYHVNDSLLVFRIDRALSGWGEVVVPTGIARVTAVEQSQVLAEVVAQFSRVRDGQLALPLEPFADPGTVRPTPVENGLVGQVVDARDLHALTSQQHIIFIDKGRSDGIVPGDVFELYRPAAEQAGGASEQVMGYLLIVHTRERSASGLVVNLRHPDIRPGLPVRLVRKMPS